MIPTARKRLPIGGSFSFGANRAARQAPSPTRSIAEISKKYLRA
jgi:hypothetical protein